MPFMVGQVGREQNGGMSGIGSRCDIVHCAFGGDGSQEVGGRDHG